jgi:DNA ligase D-like protein (predicted 3'-phosphoesterase)
MKHIFVVQKHYSSHLHYDFRLEVGGVLKSWAIPKEPSNDVHSKRLAIETEDHPLEYAKFEGTIPKGQYGGGKVEIWDQGNFENITSKNGKVISINRAINEGHLNIWLEGNRLHGKFTLIFFKNEKDQKYWLLIKSSFYDNKNT